MKVRLGVAHSGWRMIRMQVGEAVEARGVMKKLTVVMVAAAMGSSMLAGVSRADGGTDGLVSSSDGSLQSRLSEPADDGEVDLPFVAGEKLSFDVTLLGIRAAEVQLHVNQMPKDGFRFVASGKTVGATDSLLGARQDASCSVDDRLIPSICRFSSENRSGVRRRELRFDQATGNVRERTLQEGKRIEQEIHFDSGLADVQDALSGLYLLRSQLPDAPGKSVMFRSMRKGKPITIEARFDRIETVQTSAGTFETAKMDVQIIEKQESDATAAASVWLTTDARRMPVKMSAAAPIGTLEATLTGAVGTVKTEIAKR